MSVELSLSLETKRKLVVLCTGLVVAIGIVALSFGVNHAISPNPNGEPPVSFALNQGSDTGVVNLTYTGNTNAIGGTLLFAENVTVSHSGQSSTWNGETENGAIRRGSTHTVTGVELGETIRITAHDSRYEKPAVIEFTV